MKTVGAALKTDSILLEAGIPTTRAAHLLLYCDILHGIGTPVERELDRANLPIGIFEMPDALVNNVLATRFVGRCARLEGVEDLGWLGASHFSLQSFTGEVIEGLRSRLGLRGKIELFRHVSGVEDSHMEVEIAARGAQAELICDMRLATDLEGMSCGEWVQLAVLIEIVRSVVGPNWSPHTFNFRTVFTPAEEAQVAFPNSRFRFGQPKTSILIDADLLDCCAFGTKVIDHNPRSQAHRIDTIKQLMRPYLLSAAPPIELMAEMTEQSVRSLQRWLADKGMTYRGLVNETRAEMAAELIAKPDLSLLEIAMHLGYENQSNFGRAFKNATGVSPARYRAGLRHGQTIRAVSVA